ncbi:MAG: aminotransferase class III-fold pyridoxal phosphate-dependent enzyme [Proteobacteria bacterium]|jgi:glutamate-1-semialdehyde 2,1-aminomutase|nr:aminotransferase class III-fold pyridoxal phosphate-dependent enzyme [Pseudomonadota bacterium]
MGKIEKKHNSLRDALERVSEEFITNNPISYESWKNASGFMPGGNTRTVLHYDPFPVTMKGGNGACLEDLDGHHYIDFLGEYSAGLYGHSNSEIVEALKEAIDGGLVLGAPNQWETKLAEEICNRFNSIDQIRFTNSGTEANLMAIGAARAYTGKDTIMVFEGGYHGGVLYFKSGSSPLNAPYPVIKAPYNDIAGTLALIKQNANILAGVLIEPMIGSGGCIPASTEFLQSLRDITKDCGICLIFDEVMTSRSSAGGLQERLGIYPDITTLGKYMGGGASFGAFGANNDIMALFDPTKANSLAHAGTFNNNVMSMAAGYTGLSKLFTSDVADQLFDQGEKFKSELNDIIKKRDVSLQVTGVGSILGLHTHSEPVSNPVTAQPANLEKLKLIHLEMMAHGFTYAQRGYLTLNLAMVPGDLERFKIAFDEVILKHDDLLS